MKLHSTDYQAHVSEKTKPSPTNKPRTSNHLKLGIAAVRNELRDVNLKAREHIDALQFVSKTDRVIIELAKSGRTGKRERPRIRTLKSKSTSPELLEHTDITVPYTKASAVPHNHVELPTHSSRLNSRLNSSFESSSLNQSDMNLLDLLDDGSNSPENEEKQIINELVKGAKEDALERRQVRIQKAHMQRIHDIHQRTPCLKHLQRGLRTPHHRRTWDDEIGDVPKGTCSGSGIKWFDVNMPPAEEISQHQVLQQYPSSTLHRRIMSVDSIMQSRNPDANLAELLVECAPIHANAKRNVERLQKAKHEFVDQEIEWDETRKGRKIVESKLFSTFAHANRHKTYNAYE